MYQEMDVTLDIIDEERELDKQRRDEGRDLTEKLKQVNFR